MGRRGAIYLSVLVVTAVACGEAAGPPPSTDPPSPPTTGTTIHTPQVAGSPPIEPPEWFPRWDDPALIAELPVGNFSGVAIGPGGLVAYGEEWGQEPTFTHVAHSADGSAWERVATFEGVRLRAVAGGGPGYVAVGGRYMPHDAHDDAARLEPAAWWSSDGRTWHAATVDVPADAGVPATFRLADYETIDGSWLEDVVYDGEVGLAVGRSAGGARNVLWTSRDGKAWTEADGAAPGGPAHVRRVVAGTASYLALGAEDPRGHDPGPVALWHSKDGASWDQVASFDPLTGPAPWWYGVVPFGTGFAAIGSQGSGVPVAWVSPDGVAWSPPHALPVGGGATINAVQSGGDLLLAAGSEGTPGGGFAPALWISADGMEWAKVAPDGEPPESYAQAIAWLDDHWLVLGRAWDLPGGEIAGVAWRGR